MTRPTSFPGRFVDVHVLHAVPFANLNRDDTNSVKTVQYGGVSRTRVSSQSWKRATRLRFEDLIGERALRTRRIGEAVATELRENRGWPAELAGRAGQHIATGSSIKADPPSKESPTWSTNALVYVPTTAVGELADLAERHRALLEDAKDIGAKDTKTTTKKSVLNAAEIDAVLRSRNGVINLFGRMLAEIDNASVDGAAQVAHAFTTHATDVEIDYFGAVDDVSDKWGDETGSAHMGQLEFSAGVFYRYATLDLADLAHNLGGDLDATRELTRAFLDAFIQSLPQAKKTATAPHTLPSLAHVVVRSDRPVSFAPAFENPVRARQEGFAEPSVTALAHYADVAHRLLGQRGVVDAGHTMTMADGPLNALGEEWTSFDELVNAAVVAALGEAGQP
ncbi:type I-E CRISPR-associated protein Cas7/Cse4/CasC [Actinoalloteichus caeruleus]|uniref:type I-E CRISPR-associated protein Cas7/Cse4/CasC n=1 Tax=Actinoalloteichus cyanogriseus TaxID=2893586 RepID=UPI003AAA7033